MDSYRGFFVGAFPSTSEETFSPSSFSFETSDSIYSVFPTLKFKILDQTGFLMESTCFTQGVPLNIKLGTSTDNLINVKFRSVRRDITGGLDTISGLNGVIDTEYLYDAYFRNRKSPNVALKQMSASDAVKKLFQDEKNIDIEDTQGNIEVYAVSDPYSFTVSKLIKLATNGSLSPYVFFWDLQNKLHFQSLSYLEEQSPTVDLSTENVSDGDKKDASNIIQSFLPFNENLDRMLPFFTVDGVALNNKLNVDIIKENIGNTIKKTIPVGVKTEITNNCYFGRQFNPKVDYSSLNTAFCADAIKQGLMLDKALCTLPLNTELVAGKTVSIDASLFDDEKKAIKSQLFSGKYLIEQSHHIWNGYDKTAFTQLVLCRSSVNAPSGSSLINEAFNS